MKKRKKALLIIGIVLAVVLIMAFMGMLRLWGQKTPVDHIIYNEDAAGIKIAVITDNTDYKMGVAEALVKKTGGECMIEVFGLEDANQVDSAEYDLVAVMAPMYAGRLQNDARKFIERNKKFGNLMLFVSAGTAVSPDFGVDAIVSATSDFESSNAPALSIDEAAEQILDKLE